MLLSLITFTYLSFKQNPEGMVSLKVILVPMVHLSLFTGFQFGMRGENGITFCISVSEKSIILDVYGLSQMITCKLLKSSNLRALWDLKHP